MSKKNMLIQDLVGASNSIGGSHETRKARRKALRRFAVVVHEAGYVHLCRAADIKGRHLRAYVAARVEKVTARTLANELAHVRQALRARGAHAVADAPNLDNRSLGVSPTCRLGTKTPMSIVELAHYCARAVALGRPGFAALLQLCWHLGLRINEALHARTDTLDRWAREIAASASVTVIAGTKGGRERIVKLHSAASALEAVDFARSIASKQSSYLVMRHDGNPAGGLKQARSIIHSWLTREGIEPHRARYAFAQAAFAWHLSRGVSEREALILVSHSLGHGDRRGRWIKSVYLQGFERMQ